MKELACGFFLFLVIFQLNAFCQDEKKATDLAVDYLDLEMLFIELETLDVIPALNGTYNEKSDTKGSISGRSKILLYNLGLKEADVLKSFSWDRSIVKNKASFTTSDHISFSLLRADKPLEIKRDINVPRGSTYRSAIDSAVRRADFDRRIGTQGSASINETAGEVKFPVVFGEIKPLIDNSPAILSSVRSVPYFREGKSIGMRLFAIRRGGFYELLGFRNGDILLRYGQNLAADPQSLLAFPHYIDKEPAPSVEIQRDGRLLRISYEIER